MSRDPAGQGMQLLLPGTSDECGQASCPSRPSRRRRGVLVSRNETDVRDDRTNTPPLPSPKTPPTTHQ